MASTYQGGIDHPSYLTRQQLPAYAKYSAGTAALLMSVSNLRIRNVSVVAQTTATGSETINFYNGTTSVGKVTVTSGVLGSVGTTGDLNTTLSAGTVFSAVMPTDTNLSIIAIMETYLDPQATWANEN